MGTQLPLPQRGTALPPNLWPICCGPVAGWINMPLGTEVNLGPGDVVLDVVAATPKRGTAPSFRPMSIVAKTAGWMKTSLGTEVDLGPGHIVLDGSQLCAKRAQQPPSFQPVSIVATVAHLSYC